MIWLIVVIVVAVDFLIVAALFWGVVHFYWGPIAGSFPMQPCADDAVTKRFQSFRVNLLNLGFSIHVAADEHWLHLEPAALLRWVGGKRASIPWESIRIRKRSKIGPWITAQVGKWKIVGPSWCLGLAEPVAARDDEAAVIVSSGEEG